MKKFGNYRKDVGGNEKQLIILEWPNFSLGGGGKKMIFKEN